MSCAIFKEKFVHISPDGRYRYGNTGDKKDNRKNRKLEEDGDSPQEEFILENSDRKENMPVGQAYNKTTDKKAANRNQNIKKNGQNGFSERRRGRSPYAPPSRKPKRTPKATEISDENNVELGNTQETETVAAIDKTLMLVSDSLSDYSRQRMRALQMSLRHYSNVDGKLSMKELNLACQDNNINLNGRIMQILQQKFEDHQGINIEKLYHYLSDAHSYCGRDSVMAMRSRNDLIPQLDTDQEEKDADLLKRLEDLLVKDNTFFDIDSLRVAFQSKDKQKTGKISSDEVFEIVALKQQPLYGALLKALVKRCDMDKNKIVSWPEFLSFLEKSQKNAWNKYPEMAALPERMKSKTPVVPEASDMLSEQTKSRLMSRLLKRSSMKKAEKLKEEANQQTESNKKPEQKEQIQTITEQLPSEASKSDEKTTVKTDITDKDNSKTSDVKNDNTKIQEELKQEDKELKKIPELKENLDPSSSNTQETSMNEESNRGEILLKDDNKAKTEESNSAGVEPIKVASTPVPVTITDSTAPLNELDSSKEENIDNKLNENKENSEKKDLHEQEEEEKEEEPKLKPRDSGGPEGGFLSLTRHGHTIRFPKPKNYESQSVKLEPPEARLRLDWVYGYRGNDCRNNIHILASGEIAYFISNIVVIYDREAHKQRHYKEHSEYIKCIALHPNGVTVATGQVSSKHRPQNKPHIRIWRSDTLQTVHVLDQFEKAVMCISFSKSQDILAAVENTVDKRLSVWDTTSGDLITQTEVETELICDISFNPKYADLLVTSGKEHLQWWKIYPESRTLQPVAKPQYDNYLRAKYIIFLAHNDKGDLVTGDSNGTIYIWGDGTNKITNFIKHAHDGPVFVVMHYKNYILSGGRDGIVYCWQCNKNMDNVGELQIPRSEGGIRMLQLQGETLIIGTTMNSMLSTQLSSKGNSPMQGIQLDPVPITQGHYDDLRGLVVMHESQLGGDFLTAGNDGVVCWFNTERRDPVCKLMLKGMQFTCADSSFDGSSVVLGTKNGYLVILHIEGESSSEVFNSKITKDRIDCVRFSPDYTLIAVASHDSSIHMYHLASKENGSFQWELKGKCLGHGEPVVEVDFSADLYNDHFFLRSCTEKPAVMYWNSRTLDPVEMTECLNISWVTEKCKITAENIGMWWSKIDQEGDINCVDVNIESSLIALGDSCGNVCLYRYPCNRKGMFCHMYHGHASVHNVSFSKDGHYVISVGGKDSCIIQWKIV